MENPLILTKVKMPNWIIQKNQNQTKLPKNQPFQSLNEKDQSNFKSKTCDKIIIKSSKKPPLINQNKTQSDSDTQKELIELKDNSQSNKVGSEGLYDNTSNNDILMINQTGNNKDENALDKQKETINGKFTKKTKRIRKQREVYLNYLMKHQNYYNELYKELQPQKQNNDYLSSKPIYRCFCGNIRSSYASAYIHLKQKHIKSNQITYFAVKAFKDQKNNKFIRQIYSLSDKDNSPIQDDDLIELQLPSNNRMIKIFSRKNIFLDQRLSNKPVNNLQPIIQQNSQTKTKKIRDISQDIKVQKVKIERDMISLSKYQKLADQYKDLLNKFSLCQKEYLHKMQGLMQENVRLYKSKERYKLKIKFLQAQLQLKSLQNDQALSTYFNQTQQKQQKCISLEQNSHKQIKIHQGQQNGEIDCSQFTLSSSQGQSYTLPQFSCLQDKTQSSYSSSIQQLKPKNNYEQAIKQYIDPKNIKPKGLHFDPDKYFLEKSILNKSNAKLIKQENSLNETIYDLNPQKADLKKSKNNSKYKAKLYDVIKQQTNQSFHINELIGQ